MSCVLLVVALFVLSVPCRLFWSLCPICSYFDKIEAVFVGGFPKLLLRSKNRIVDGGMRAPTVGDRKRGAVGARVDFLDVVGIGGRYGQSACVIISGKCFT